MKQTYTVEFFQKSADFLRSKVTIRPKVAIVLGSCLGDLSDLIKEHKVQKQYFPFTF